MRNLKRALSLTLASVMLLGMMVVGSSAAAGFPDVDENDNVEAIEVLQAVEVMVGDDRGFGPDRPVTRNEMAVVMGKLLNLDYNYYSSTCPFTDVAPWARGWVGACYANGIVSGRGESIYDGEATVTAVEAASMMMRALGYFKYDSDYADGFVLSTVRQASRIGLFADVNADTDSPMTRNQVAQLALNTLEATIVDAKKTSADITVGSGDTAVNITGSVEYIVRTGATNDKMATAIKSGSVSSGSGTDGTYGETIELGEQLYSGDLEKKPTSDAFGAPASRWLYKKAEIGVYADEADATYTSEVKVKDIYKDLALNDEVSDDDLKISEDGATYTEEDPEKKVTKLVKSGDDGDKKLGGNGVLVKAYKVDDDEVTICIINTYVLQVDGDYNTKKEELQLKTPDGTKALPGKTSAKLSGDDFAGLSYYADEDYVLVTVADEEIQTIKAAETLTETVTAYVAKRGDDNSSSVTAGSTYKYDKSYTATDKTYEIGEQYVLVLDNYGYVIFADGVDVDDQYVYVADQAQQSGVKADYEADAYFVDGTNEVVIVDDKGAAAADHTWYTYEKKASGKYELTNLKAAEDIGGGGTAIASGTITDTNSATVTYASGKSFRANNTTTFIVLRDDTVYVYNGIRNVPKITAANSGAYVNAVMDGSFAKYVFIEAAAKNDLNISGSADAHIYIYDEEPTKTNNDKGDPIFIYKVIKDGALTTVTMSGSNYATNKPWTLGLYGNLTTDSNGYIDSADRITDTTDENLWAYKLTDATLDIKGDVLVVGGVDLVMAGNCKIWVSDGNDTTDITRSQFTRDYAKDPFTGALFVVVDSDEIVTEVYVDEDSKAMSGLTENKATNVWRQPESTEELTEWVKQSYESGVFNKEKNTTGCEGLVSLGVKQYVTTNETGKPTIHLYGTIDADKVYNKSSDAATLEMVNLFYWGKTSSGDWAGGPFTSMTEFLTRQYQSEDTVFGAVAYSYGDIHRVQLLKKGSDGSAKNSAGATSVDWGDFAVDWSELKFPA